MNKKYLLSLAVAGAVCAGFAAKKDPVVMRIAGRDVPRSEFEYLYNKNAGQQVEQQSLDDYVELFKIYKLKVADALAHGIDTTAAFRRELAGYERDLAAPYMIDSAYYYRLMHEIYNRGTEEVEARHIMFFKPREFGGQVSRKAYDRADSVLTALRGGASFEELARTLSEDRSSAEQGGSMGYITVGITPYDFETAVYETPEGQISDIVESPVGMHIIKGGKHRPARGTVQLEQITLLIPRDAAPEQVEEVTALADSIYTVATTGETPFSVLAARHSQDPRTARQGGAMGYIGVGQIWPQVDSVAFAMNVGQISEPIRTPMGYMIIKKTDAKPYPSFEENAPMYRRMLDANGGPYTAQLINQFTGKLRKKYRYKEDKKLLQAIMTSAGDNKMDSVFYATWQDSNATIATFADTTLTAGGFMQYLRRYAPETSAKGAPRYVKKIYDSYVNHAVFARALDDLPAENADFRNLIGEYRDGMLLFEISNRNVWERAAKDTEGLEQFFQANRSDYTWQTPHVKGILVQAPSDSVASLVQTAIANLPEAEALDTIRAQFPNVKADRMLVAKGDNMLIDALAFSGEPVSNPDSKYPAYFMAYMRVITEPEEAADVRAQATADYQNALEREWVEQLRATYPIEVFPKELSKVKPAKK